MREIGFIFFKSFYDGIKCLSDSKRLELLDAILKYAFEEIEPKFSDNNLEAMFSLIKDRIKIMEVEL